MNAKQPGIARGESIEGLHHLRLALDWALMAWVGC